MEIFNQVNFDNEIALVSPYHCYYALSIKYGFIKVFYN